MVKILEMPIFIFREIIFEVDPIFDQKLSKKVPPNGHNFPLTELKCNYLGISERSYHVEFEKNKTKTFLGQKIDRVTSCSIFLGILERSYHVEFGKI
jgi:hypothetical protein